MNQSIAAKVEKYLEIFEEVRNKVGDDRVALTILQETAKDKRMDEMREEREARNGEPATARQLQYLKTLKVKASPGLTKKQASLLIDENVERED